MSNNELARLRWKCRRGMLELDVLLQRFIDRELPQLSPQQLTTFDRLLDEADPVLYAWLLRREVPQDKALAGMVQLILSA